MRFYAKFTVALASFTALLHYYCSTGERSVELQQFCRYTSPTVWDELLVEQNVFYKNNVHPVLELIHGEYASRVEPHLSKLGSDVHDKVYTPALAYTKESYDSSFQWISEHIFHLRRKVGFYYNVMVRPTIQKIVYYCKLDEICAALHSRLGPFLEKIRFVWHYLRPYTVKARSSVEQGYSDLRNIYYRSSHWMTGGTFEEKKTPEQTATCSDSETEVESDDEDEEEDIETSTITSTVLVTVTMDDNSVASQTEEAALQVSEQEALEDEFNAWFHLIDQKSSNLIKMFNKDVEKMAKHKIAEFEPLIQGKTNHAHQTAQQYFKKLNKAIQDINCTSEVTKSGEIIYFDQSGTTQLADYITRPLVRAIFNETHSELESLSKEIEKELQNLTDNIQSHVTELREDLIEVYEEWGDVMISEWSKRLAYVDVVAVHLNDNEEDQLDISQENWRRFLQLKKQVIKARDDLANHPGNVEALKTFLNKAQWIIETITKESGEYLYILRARANLAFQERERQERERSGEELATSHPRPSVNGTVPHDQPNHVEDQVHKPIEESAPAIEDLEI